MKSLAFIVFPVTSGPAEGLRITVFEPCTVAVLEAGLGAFEDADLPAMAQCYYGNGPMTSMRPVARPEGGVE